MLLNLLSVCVGSESSRRLLSVCSRMKSHLRSVADCLSATLAVVIILIACSSFVLCNLLILDEYRPYCLELVSGIDESSLKMTS